MSLTKSTKGSNGSLSRSGLGFASFLTPQVARALGSAIASAINGSGKGGNQASPQIRGGGSSNSSGASGRPRKRKGKWTTYGSGPSAPLILNPQLKKMTGTFTGAFSLGNVATNTFQYYYTLAYDGGTGNGILNYLNIPDRAIFGGFTFFRIRKLGVNLMPIMGTNATGYVAIGYTDNVASLTAPTGSADITALPQSCFGPAWTNLEMSITPQNKENEYYLNSVGSDLNHRSPGVLKIYGSNAAATNVQTIFVTLSITMDLW